MINLDKLIKERMKAHDKVGLRAFKNLKAEIQRYETAKDSEPLTDSKQFEIFAKYCKKLEDSIRQFSETRREDLMLEYASELNAIQHLIPAPVTGVELHDFINEDEEFFDQYFITIENYDKNSDTNYTHMEIQIPKKDMGKAIQYVKSKFPTTDGRLISEVIKEYVK